MKRFIRIVTLATLLVVALAPAPVAAAGTRSLHGRVLELGDRYFVLADEGGKEHKIWLVAESGYRPGDYRPAIDDEVEVSCWIFSSITRRMYLRKVVFVKENFKPAE